MKPLACGDFRENRAIECRILICPEDVGGYSAYAVQLPGVVSQGETIEEATDNVTDAFQAAIQTYFDEGMRIPWADVEVERRDGSVERWILVNV